MDWTLTITLCIDFTFKMSLHILGLNDFVIITSSGIYWTFMTSSAYILGLNDVLRINGSYDVTLYILDLSDALNIYRNSIMLLFISLIYWTLMTSLHMYWALMT